MVVIKKARYVNFCNIEDTTVELQDQKLVLVTGENGSGKSTLFIDGIFYTLYGESFKYGSKPGDSVVNEFKDKSADSYCEMELDVDGEKYRIVRSRKSATSKGVSLYHGDTDISRGTSDETQKAINSLLGMSSNTFQHSVVFTPDMLKFPSLSDAQKKDIFDELLQLSCFEPALKETKEKLKEAISSRKVLDRGIDTLTESVKNTKQSLAEASAEESVWEKSRDAKLDALQTLVDEATRLVKQAEAKMNQLREPDTSEIQKAEDRCKKLREAIEEERSNQRLEESEQTKRKVSIAKCEQEIIALNRSIEKMQKLSAQGLCPTCKQPVQGEDHGDEISKAVDEIASIEKRIGEIKLCVKQGDATIREMSEGITTAENKVVEVLSKATESRKALEAYNTELRGAKYDKSLKEKELNNQIAALERERITENPYSNTVALCKRELSQFQDKLQKAEEHRVKIKQIIADEEVLEECFGNKGAKLLMVRTALPLLNREAKRIQAIMNTDIQVSFTLREAQESYAGSLQVAVKNPRGASSYSGDSSGERGRVDLIILLSLLSLAASRGRKSFAQVFFDEVFESLDKSGQAAALAVIRDISSTKSSVFIISHTAEELGGQCDKVLTIQKGKIAA